MIKTPVDLSKLIPIGREMAAQISSAASLCPCTVTLEHDGIVLNLKSMIGLLSQSIPRDGKMTLVADGPDEEKAVQAVLKVICR